jgi:hypothetical protein
MNKKPTQAFSSVAERCLAKGSSIRFIFYSGILDSGS